MQRLSIYDFVWDKDKNVLHTTATRSGFVSSDSLKILITGSGKKHEVLFHAKHTYSCPLRQCPVIEYYVDRSWGKTFHLSSRPLKVEISLR